MDVTGPPEAADAQGGHRALKFAKVRAFCFLALQLNASKAWMTGETTTDAMRCFNMSLLSALLLDTAGPMYK